MRVLYNEIRLSYFSSAQSNMAMPASLNPRFIFGGSSSKLLSSLKQMLWEHPTKGHRLLSSHHSQKKRALLNKPRIIGIIFNYL